LQREARKYLYGIRQAAARIAEFTAGRSIDDYLADVMLARLSNASLRSSAKP